MAQLELKFRTARQMEAVVVIQVGIKALKLIMQHRRIMGMVWGKYLLAQQVEDMEMHTEKVMKLKNAYRGIPFSSASGGYGDAYRESDEIKECVMGIKALKLIMQHTRIMGMVWGPYLLAQQVEDMEMHTETFMAALVMGTHPLGVCVDTSMLTFVLYCNEAILLLRIFFL